ncbi:hypothetical protein GCM10009550_75380 [Actinocorallia libanotica]|uniref:Uncharacterized protein n=1 Tax=Actinocorallia libanotica TaxID=46162 RepID=A0ABN1S071_9ACTN
MKDERNLGSVAFCPTEATPDRAAMARAPDPRRREPPGARDVALTGNGHTAEALGRAAGAVGWLFSCDHPDPGATRKTVGEPPADAAVVRHERFPDSLRDFHRNADSS